MALILFEVNDTDKTVKYITDMNYESTIDNLPVYQMVALHDEANRLGILGSGANASMNSLKIA